MSVDAMQAGAKVHLSRSGLSDRDYRVHIAV
jgi:hypothetical protein